MHTHHAFVPSVVFGILFCSYPSLGTPLWESSRYTIQDRDRAILRGIDFLKEQSKLNFVQHARDYMLGFHLISQSSLNETVRSTAKEAGVALAKVWRQSHWEFPKELTADKLRMLVGDIFNAERLGVELLEFKAKLEQQIDSKSFDFFFWV